MTIISTLMQFLFGEIQNTVYWSAFKFQFLIAQRIIFLLLLFPNYQNQINYWLIFLMVSIIILKVYSFQDLTAKQHRWILDLQTITLALIIAGTNMGQEAFAMKYISKLTIINFQSFKEIGVILESYEILLPLFFSYNRFISLISVLITVLSRINMRIQMIDTAFQEYSDEFGQLADDSLSINLDFVSVVSNAVGSLSLVIFILCQIQLDFKLQQSDMANHNKDIQVMKVIHDLKNPILSIKNNLIDFKINPDSVVKTTQMDCEDMEEMLENMRAEFKLKQGMQLKEELKDIESEEFAKGFNSTHTNLCENGKNFLHIIVEKTFPKVLSIPRTLIKRMTNNFITNSLKHTEKGHVQIKFIKCSQNDIFNKGENEVQVGPDPDPQSGQLSIEISDTGGGIPKNKLNLVFDEKESDQSGANFDGTGLGLPICKQLCYQIGAFIRYSSTQDPEKHGTKFTLYFRDTSKQLSLGKEFKIEQDYLTNEEDKTSTFTHTCNMLLIAEDSKSIMKRYCKWLDKEQFPYRPFYNGRDLLEYIHMSNQIGCTKCSKIMVVTDMFMPQLNGNELAIEIRKIRGEKNFKLVLVSADEIVDPNFDIILEKPASMNTLKEIYIKQFRNLDIGSIKMNDKQFNAASNGHSPRESANKEKAKDKADKEKYNKIVMLDSEKEKQKKDQKTSDFNNINTNMMDISNNQEVNGESTSNQDQNGDKNDIKLPMQERRLSRQHDFISIKDINNHEINNKNMITNNKKDSNLKNSNNNVSNSKIETRNDHDHAQGIGMGNPIDKANDNGVSSVKPSKTDDLEEINLNDIVFD